MTMTFLLAGHLCLSTVTLTPCFLWNFRSWRICFSTSPTIALPVFGFRRERIMRLLLEEVKTMQNAQQITGN
jgi:hypothetical protein